MKLKFKNVINSLNDLFIRVNKYLPDTYQTGVAILVLNVTNRKIVT